MIPRLFENFNLPDGADDEADALPPEPMFSQAELAAARAEAWNDGYLAAARQTAERLARDARLVFADLLARSEEMDSQLVAMAEQNAAAVAHWLADSFVAAFPGLAAAAMDQRIRRVAELLQPVLKSQVNIEVHDGSGPPVRCDSLSDVWRHIQARQTEHPTGGDIVVAWPRGEARISGDAAWQDIRAAMMPLTQDAPDDAAFRFTIKRTEYAGHVG
jgi:hypothetical protein